MTSYKVEALPTQQCVLGEGPHWDEKTQNLFFIDIYGGTVNRYSMTENKNYSATIGKSIFNKFYFSNLNFRHFENCRKRKGDRIYVSGGGK